jgi:septum formation protein
MRELREIVLASISPRRRELLSSLGLHVIVVPSEIDEGDRPGHAPLDLAKLHAGTKADAVAAREAQRVTLGADTVVELDGASLGKPRDRGEAAAMLAALAGREHLVHTAFALVDGPSRRRVTDAVTTRVRFYALGRDEIDRYVESGDPMDKAGAYGIQGVGAALVERIDGDFYGVMGLPLGRVVRGLRTLGYSLPPERSRR